MKETDLTERQEDFLIEYWRLSLRLEMPPTVREIAECSTWNAQQLLDQLIKKGYLSRTSRKSRGTRLTAKARDWLEIKS